MRSAGIIAAAFTDAGATCEQSGEVVIENTRFPGNQATIAARPGCIFGGTIKSNSNRLELTRSSFVSNQVDNGGAIEYSRHAQKEFLPA